MNNASDLHDAAYISAEVAASGSLLDATVLFVLHYMCSYNHVIHAPDEFEVGGCVKRLGQGNVLS